MGTKRAQKASWNSFCHWTDNAVVGRYDEAHTGQRHCACCFGYECGVCIGCPLHEYGFSCFDCKGPYVKAMNARLRWENARHRWEYNNERGYDGKAMFHQAATNMALLLLLLYYSEGGE